MKVNLDKRIFGPWALVTGASAGIGRGFAWEIARSGINVVLLARRGQLLEEVARGIQSAFGVDTRVLPLDLCASDSFFAITAATEALDIGLVVSNAGTGHPGKFLSLDLAEKRTLLQLNTVPHLELAHHFGAKLAKRGRGGILFVGAMGADKGIPYMSNDAGAKAYVQKLSESLHDEFKPLGIHVTALLPGPTDTPVLAKFGITPEMMPMKAMSVEQCVSESLLALASNRSVVIPGRLNRVMNALLPAAVTRRLMAHMFARASAAAERVNPNRARGAFHPTP
jgi:short-subunit dehydrogenase